ncbi:MAG: hypothetical protein WCP10_02325 [Desulfuromonadales bacterium]
MKGQGPALDRLIHRLAECPPDFLAEPRIGSKSGIHTAAVVHDLLFELGGSWPPPSSVGHFGFASAERRNWLRLVAVASWLLYDDWFRTQRTFAKPALEWLRQGLNGIAELVTADLFVTDPDRREELARLCLSALGLLPSGENEHQAEDRLKSLNSVERVRLIKETQEQQKRARQLREEMRRKEAIEAAARVSRE